MFKGIISKPSDRYTDTLCKRNSYYFHKFFFFSKLPVFGLPSLCHVNKSNNKAVKATDHTSKRTRSSVSKNKLSQRIVSMAAIISTNCIGKLFVKTLIGTSREKKKIILKKCKFLIFFGPFPSLASPPPTPPPACGVIRYCSFVPWSTALFLHHSLLFSNSRP